MPVNFPSITSSDDFDKAKSEGTIVVYCTASGSGYNQLMDGRIETCAKLYTQVKFYQVNLDEADSVVDDQLGGVSKLPTYFLFKNGEKAATVTGIQDHPGELAAKLGLPDCAA